MADEPEERPSMTAIHIAVRNILFNEMGLSRKSIEDLVRDEVTGVTDRRFRDMEEVESFIVRAVSKVVYGRYNRLMIENMVDDIVKKSVNSHVKGIVDDYLKDRLTVTITTAGIEPAWPPTG